MTTLVLLPGLDGTEVLFQPLLESLPESVRPLVVAYPEGRGSGYAELLELVRDALAGVDECHVLGWSFSGPLALMLAAAEPLKVRSVILSASFVRPPQPMLQRLHFVAAAPMVWLWRAARRLPLWLLRATDDPLRRAKTQTWCRVPARVIAARLRAVLAVDARAPLEACPQPVLYIACSDDAIVPRHNVAEIVRIRPSVEVVTIDGPHLAMYGNPQPAALAVARFIERSGRARAAN